MKISLHCRSFNLPSPDLAAGLDVARMADEAGLYGIHFGEHVVMGKHIEAYPYQNFQHPLDAGWPDPIALLSAMAAVTHQIRLSTGVLLVPLRSGPMLAKSVATVDVLSHGRVELGVGTGWQREEYDAAGLDWSTRNQQLRDSLRCCRALWAPEQPVAFESPSFSFTDIYCSPRPVQSWLPLLFGWKMTAKNAAFMAEVGDGWLPTHVQPEELPADIDVLRRAFDEAGRDPAQIIVRVPVPEVLDSAGRIDIEATLERARKYLDAGATIVGIVTPAAARDLDEVETFVHRLAELSKD